MIKTVSNDNTLYFCLTANSGNVLLQSSLFENEMAMKKALEQLQTLPLSRSNFERRTNHKGQFVFFLKDSLGNKIGESQTYDSEMGMENGIKNLVKRIEVLREEGHL